MRLCTYQELLQQAINYIEANNECLAECHTNPNTKTVEPDHVRAHVEAVRRWVANARQALKPPVTVQVTGQPYLDLPTDWSDS